jgi:hypothetical protein
MNPDKFQDNIGIQGVVSRLAGSDMHDSIKNMVDNPVIAHHIYLARPAVPRRLRPMIEIRKRRVASRGYYPVVRGAVTVYGAVVGGTFEKGGRLR